MPQKTITVEHPGAHQPSEADYDAALIEAEIPEGYSIARSVNESGVKTTWTLKWGEDAPETQADPPVPASDPEPRGRKRS